jgi:hypothetical protein
MFNVLMRDVASVRRNPGSIILVCATSSSAGLCSMIVLIAETDRQATHSVCR